jgi:hypothetical protein
MLGVNHLVGFGAGGKAPNEFAFLQNYSNTSDNNTHTLSSVSIGNPYPTRHIVIGIAAEHKDDGGMSLTSATIGGVTATIHEQGSIVTGTTDDLIAIISAIVPSGTTADVVLNYSGTIYSVQIGVYRGIRSNTSVNEVSTYVTSADGASVVYSPLGTNDYGIAVAMDSDATYNEITWTNATANFQNNVENNGASMAIFFAQTSVTASCSGDTITGTAVSWSY